MQNQITGKSNDYGNIAKSENNKSYYTYSEFTRQYKNHYISMIASSKAISYVIK